MASNETAKPMPDDCQDTASKLLCNAFLKHGKCNGTVAMLDTGLTVNETQLMMNITTRAAAMCPRTCRKCDVNINEEQHKGLETELEELKKAKEEAAAEALKAEMEAAAARNRVALGAMMLDEKCHNSPNPAARELCCLK